MYYMHNGRKYHDAVVNFDSSGIELYAREQNLRNGRFIWFVLFMLPLGLIERLIGRQYLIKRILCHRLEFSNNIRIDKINSETIMITSQGDKEFLLYHLNSDIACKLLSLNNYKGIKYRVDTNDKLKASFGHSLNDSRSETSRNQIPEEKVMYVKVKTRSDIPEGAEFDDQTGSKIVYVVMDED